MIGARSSLNECCDVILELSVPLLGRSVQNRLLAFLFVLQHKFSYQLLSGIRVRTIFDTLIPVLSPHKILDAFYRVHVCD